MKTMTCKRDSRDDIMNSELIERVSITYTRRPHILLPIVICVCIACVLFVAIFIMVMIIHIEPYNMSYEVERDLHKSRVRAELYAMLQQPSTPLEDYGQMDPDKVISCYYCFPNDYKQDKQLSPSQIHPYLCTHINVAFAMVTNKEIALDILQRHYLTEIVKLKIINPKLKILLSIGGAGDDDGFSDMVVDHASRKIFIKSIKSILRDYSLDGIDIDWEFPVLHKNKTGHSRERQHFSQLLREIRAEYAREKRYYALTVAVAAPETIADVSYDVDQLNMYVDFVNIMTYDFHSYTKYTPLTGLNSPVYAGPTERTFLATLNINYTVHIYISKGLDRNKIVVGIPTYGHSFSLQNKKNTGISSPASGYGCLGDMGFVNYPNICTFINDHKCEVTIEEDEIAKVPYLYRDTEWVSYDNPKSVMEKAKYIKENGLRGAMIYSLNADDFEGVCEKSLNRAIHFPLSKSVREALAVHKMDNDIKATMV